MTFLTNIDTQLFLILNVEVANGLFDVIMPYVTNIKYWRWPAVGAMLAVFLFGGKYGKWSVLFAGLLLGVEDLVVSGMLKPWIGRLRPCHVIETARVLDGCGGTNAMPSGHAAGTMAAALWFGWRYPKWLWYAVALSVTVSYSRIYMGIHYPGDILAGWVVAAVLVTLFVVVSDRLAGQLPGQWGDLRCHRRQRAP